MSEVFGNNIFTRKTISNFFEMLNNQKDNKIEIDFSKIDFISRSCVDEYIKQKSESNKEIIEVNMPDELCAMFEVVRRQYKSAGMTFLFEICKPNLQHTLTA